MYVDVDPFENHIFQITEGRRRERPARYLLLFEKRINTLDEQKQSDNNKCKQREAVEQRRGLHEKVELAGAKIHFSKMPNSLNLQLFYHILIN